MSRGLAYFKLGNLTASLQDLTFAINRGDISSADLYFNRGVVYQEMKNYNDATQDYMHCLKIQSDYDCAYYNLGIIYFEQENYKKALEMFNNSILINPKDVFSYFNRGYASYRLNNFVEAILDFEYSLKLDSTDYKSLKWIGKSYLMLGEDSLGWEYLRKAKGYGIDVEI